MLRKEKFTIAFLIAIATALPQSPAFDVAWVRPMIYDDGALTHIYNSPRNSEFKAVNVTLTDLLEVPYGIPDTRMLNVPAWAQTEKFDLEAKFDPEIESGKERKRQMLRALLAEWFKVTAHTEQREIPVLALRIAKDKSKLRATDSAAVGLSGGRDRISITGGGGDDALAVLAYELSWPPDRPVIDQTGLKGRYAFTLNWSEDGPSLFTALQEQLGLKLESAKAPVRFLAIDHAEKPSAN